MLSGYTYFRWISMIYFTIYLIFNGKSISQWEHHIPSIKRCEAIRPALNCFISMIISIDTLCGFAPLFLVDFDDFLTIYLIF